jgi:hypothetical protein
MYKTVRKVNNALEAHIIKGRLESEGIEAFVTDENTIMNNPFYKDDLGGARVQVNAIDYEKAIEILDSLDNAKFN